MAADSNTPCADGELVLFSLAKNWKRYVKTQIQSYLIGDVLEVGAGIGATTAALHDDRARRWVCLEPDVRRANQLQVTLTEQLGIVSVIVGSLSALADRPSFDCVLYVDVLEHIRDDQSQIYDCARLVRAGGYIVVLAPAHPWLFSKFDQNVGHLRRYDKARLQSLMPAGWSKKKLAYLDSVGILLCLGNAFVLRQAIPSRLQIFVWDRLCVPLSQVLDRLLFGTLGKSVLAVWQRPVSD